MVMRARLLLVSALGTGGVASLWPNCPRSNTTLTPTNDVSGTADLLALRSAVESLEDHGCILFHPGLYFYDCNFARKYAPLTSPSVVGELVGRFDYRNAMAYIHGLRGITVAGPESDSESGGEAVIQIVNYDKSRGDQPSTPVFLIAESSDVTVQDLTIRHAPNDLNHILAEVISVPAKGNSLLIKITGEHLPLKPASYESGSIPNPCPALLGVLYDNDVFYAERFMRLDSQGVVTGWEFFTDLTGRSTGMQYDASYAQDQSGCGDRFGGKTATLAPNCAMVVVEFFDVVHSGENSSPSQCRKPDESIGRTFHVGDRLVIVHELRATSGVRFETVDGLNLFNLTFGNVAGPSIGGERVRNIHVLNQRTEAPPGGWQSVNDALWVRGYGGSDNRVEGMTLENLSDDFLNFHTSTTGVDRTVVEGDLVTQGDRCVKVEQPWWWEEIVGPKVGTEFATILDTVHLYDESEELLWKGMFVGRREFNKTVSMACFLPHETDLSVLDYVLHRAMFATAARWMPAERTDGRPSLLIRDVTVRNSRSRGLIKGSHTLVEGLTVKDNVMDGLLISSDPAQGEGTPASHVTIRNALFENIALDTKRHLAAILVGSKFYRTGKIARGLDGLSVLAHLHRNIEITDVVVRNVPQAALFFAGVDGLRLRNITLQDVHAKADPFNEYNEGKNARRTTVPRPFVPPGSEPVYLLDVTCAEGYLQDNKCFLGMPNVGPQKLNLA